MNDSIMITQPRQLNFGAGCMLKLAEDLHALNVKKILVITLSDVCPLLDDRLFNTLKINGIAVTTDTSIKKEPTFADFNRVLEMAKEVDPDGIIGIGGGSVLDVAKLVAAQLKNTQSLEEIVGINKLKRRDLLLVCMPTTSGTGSEVSPNAIFLDEKDDQKKGIISPFLMPDVVYADPGLTVTLPPAVTAATGIDALTHCIEAYANEYAHPLVDVYALEGIRLISANIVQACQNGRDLEARSAMLRGSLFGGICLGPVNTAAVHALSYPLGSHFHIAHGLSNAILLPHVLDFNLSAAPDRYAAIAEAMGCPRKATAEATARAGIQKIKTLMKDCNMPLTISALNITEDAIEQMATDAMKVTRLLKNNVRAVQLKDAIKIYQSAY